VILIAVARGDRGAVVRVQAAHGDLLLAFWKKAGSAVVTGTAIYGMHYAGMAAADFAPGSVSAAAPQRLDPTWLAITLGVLALLFLLAALTVSAFDSYIAARSLLHERERLARDRRDHMIELASVVAHEINQPLAAIAANAGAGERWLKAEPPNIDEANGALRAIARDADHSARFSPAHGLSSAPRDAQIAGRHARRRARRAGRRGRQRVQLRRRVTAGGGRDLPEVRADRGQIHAVRAELRGERDRGDDGSQRARARAGSRMQVRKS